MIRLDNLTPAVTWAGSDRRITEGFTRFCAHHGITPEFCNPRAGWEKGHVEGRVRYIRNNFFVPVPKFRSLGELNADLQIFCAKDRARAHYRKHVRILDLLDAERAVMRTAWTPSGMADRRIATVDKRGYVCVRGNAYFTAPYVPAASRVVTVCTAREVSIHAMEGGEIARYPREPGRGAMVTTAPQLARDLARKPKAIPYIFGPSGPAVGGMCDTAGREAAILSWMKDIIDGGS